MQTPWGALESLDLADMVLAERILSADKHQLIEGLVVESLFDQFVDGIPNHVPGILPLDVETIIVDRQSVEGRWLAVVWARSKTEGLGRFLSALESRCTVVLVEFEPAAGFHGARIVKGKRNGPLKPLNELLEPLAINPYTPCAVDASVRDSGRQRKAIWGFLFDHYGERLSKAVLLPRLLINYGVQPWFRGVWNLDRAFIVDGVPWLFEVKHKFPFPLGGSLNFGINNGELNVLGLLAECGVRTLHSIMVKPRWSKSVGSQYMLNDLAARDRAAIVGVALDEEGIIRIMSRASGTSGANTTITGTGSLSYKPIPVTDFGMFGVFSDKPAMIAEKLSNEMRGVRSSRVTEKALQLLRLPV